MFDPLYMMIMLPALILAGLASLLTRFTFNKYSKQRASSGLTGAQAAQRLLAMQGVREVAIEPVQGFLSDHYDPRSKTLRLSPEVYASPSLAAIGVACHEAGHACSTPPDMPRWPCGRRWYQRLSSAVTAATSSSYSAPLQVFWA